MNASHTAGPVEALSGWSGNKPGNDSGIVMSMRSTLACEACPSRGVWGNAPLSSRVVWGHAPPQENFEFCVGKPHSEVILAL